MQVRFYKNFHKRINSTLIPDGVFTALDLECTNPLNLLTPEFLINLDRIDTDWNYCYVEKFRRYYWVNGFALSGVHGVVTTTVDVLASFAFAIKVSTQRIERAYSEYDGTISDGLVFATSAITSDVKTGSFGNFSADYSAGTYIITVSGNATGTTQGSNVIYALSPANFYAMCNYMFNGISWMGVTDISEALQKSILNPMQYITSARWYPIPYNDVTGIASVSNIPVGYWSIPAAAKKIGASAVIIKTAWVEIPRTTESKRAELLYMQGEPYTKLYLTVKPFCTQLQLPATTLIGCLYLKCTLGIDLTSGYGRLVCDGYVNQTDASPNIKNVININTNYGVAVPIAQQTNSIPSSEQLILSAVGGIAEGVATLKE